MGGSVDRGEPHCGLWVAEPQAAWGLRASPMGRLERADGSAGGSVSFLRIPHGPNRRSLAWRIGITVLPDRRDLRFGLPARQRIPGAGEIGPCEPKHAFAHDLDG